MVYLHVVCVDKTTAIVVSIYGDISIAHRKATIDVKPVVDVVASPGAEVRASNVNLASNLHTAINERIAIAYVRASIAEVVAHTTPGVEPTVGLYYSSSLEVWRVPKASFKLAIVEVYHNGLIGVSNVGAIARVVVSTTLPVVSTQMSTQIVYAAAEVVYLVIEVVYLAIDVVYVTLYAVNVWHLHFKLLVLQCVVSICINMLYQYVVPLIYLLVSSCILWPVVCAAIIVDGHTCGTVVCLESPKLNIVLVVIIVPIYVNRLPVWIVCA